MNIEEAKKIVDKLSVDSDELWKIPMIPAHKVKALLDTLDQPKPEVPQCVAEWLEGLKKEFPDNLPNQLYHVTRQGWGYGFEYEDSYTEEMKTLYNCGGKIKKDLVNALLYGYTVEKEKLYKVRMFGSIGYNHRSFTSLSRTDKIVGSTDSSDVFFQSV